MKKKLVVPVLALLLTLALFTYHVAISHALECSPTGATEEERKQIAEKCRQKIAEARNQKSTLSSQIEIIDNQIYLKTLEIENSQAKIVQTEKEMEIIDSRISGLDSSLDYLSKLMLQKVVEGYKKNTSVSLFDILLDSNNADDLINRFKYMQTVRNNNQKLLVQVQESKLNFEKQKSLRETKKEELDNLVTILNSQKADLKNQQAAKRILLIETQNDEARYQSYLAQVEAFKSFVQSTGVGTIAPNALGTGEGGWYYSQRDSRWANARMGSSNDSVLDVGCFITSIAMVMKFYGNDYTPLNIASNSNYFLPYSAYMYRPDNFNGSWPSGKNYHNISYSEISSYLNRNIPVIAGVRGATHYVVLKKEDGGDFVMNDPIYGPDIKVSQYYSLSGPYGVFE